MPEQTDVAGYRAMGAVLVTGASSGIGETCAVHLAHLGFTVFAGVRRNEDAARLEGGAGGRLVPVRLDVTDAESIAAAEQWIHSRVGDRGLSGLVNNAGISVAGPLELLPVEELRAQLEVNVIGVHAVTQAFLPLLRQTRGRIVNIGSISGRNVLPFLGAYAASKFALEAMTDALRMELSPWGIPVSIVEPGRIATPLIEKTRGRSQAVVARSSPENRALYERTLAAAVRVELARRAIPVDGVVDAVIHALTARKPKTRYLIGRDAHTRRLLQRLPDRLRDRVLLRALRRADG